MTSQSIVIRANQLDLSGVLHMPEGVNQRKVPLIVFVHGFIGSKVGEHRLFVKAARYFTDKGYAVFRFDFSGSGESDGDYADVTVTKQLSEVQSVLNVVSKLPQVDANNIILIGHSLGGAIASLTAAKDRRVRHLILWSPVGQPYEDITKIIGGNAVETAAMHGVVDYQGFYVSQTFLTDLKNHHPFEAIRLYPGAALIIHAQEDKDITKEHAASYAVALQQRSISEQVDTYYIKDADHTFSSYLFEHKLFEESAEWLEERYAYPNKIAL